MTGEFTKPTLIQLPALKIHAVSTITVLHYLIIGICFHKYQYLHITIDIYQTETSYLFFKVVNNLIENTSETPILNPNVVVYVFGIS